MADNNIDIVITASGNSEKVISGIANALSGIADTVGKLTSEYIAYGDQVKSLSLFTGMQADETSRLIQLADDAFVSFETLRMSARLLADKGIAPTTENLAKLSDAYLKLEPGVARSQFLLENFGRAGMEMGKVMELSGEKIRTMSASVEAGLIIDEAKLANITASKQALDAFNDSMDAMKFQVAGELLTIFQNMPPALQKFTLAIGALNNAGALQNIAALLITLQSMNSLMPGLALKIGTATTALLAWVSATVAAVGPWLALGAVVVSVLYIIYSFIRGLDAVIQRFAVLISKGASLKRVLAELAPYNIFGRAVESAVADYWALTGGVHKASGGPVLGGSPYIVGERGPELFMPSGNGTIIPNNKLGGGGTVVINYQPTISLADRFELETKLTPIIRNAMRGIA